MVENARTPVPGIAACRGIVTGRTEVTGILVELRGHPAPVPCQVVTPGPHDSFTPKAGDEVLVALDSCEESGYILGFIQRRPDNEPESPGSAPAEEAGGNMAVGVLKRPTNITVNGKSISIEATDEIHIRCGKSSIDLLKDGKVVIRGTYLVSRSSGLNKIKGAAVGIN